MKTTTKLWIGIAILIGLSPLGLLLPAYFKAGAAWGEWGLVKMHNFAWNAPIPDYAFKDWGNKGLSQLSFAYIVSAGVGIIAVILLVWVIGKILIKK